MEHKKPPFQKKVFIKNYKEFKDKINKKANHLIDDFKKGDRYVTQRMRQMINTTQEYVREKDIKGTMKKIDWVKGAKATLLILVILGTIASQNPILFKTVVQAVVISSDNMVNLAGLKTIIPVIKTLFGSLNSIEKVMIFVSVLNVFMDDIPKAINVWRYDKSSLTSFTRDALKGTLKAAEIANKAIKYEDKKEIVVETKEKGTTTRAGPIITEVPEVPHREQGTSPTRDQAGRKKSHRKKRT